MNNCLLVANKRKICLENCGYDRSMTCAIDEGIIDLKDMKRLFKEGFSKFTPHKHKTKIIKTIEILC